MQSLSPNSTRHAARDAAPDADDRHFESAPRRLSAANYGVVHCYIGESGRRRRLSALTAATGLSTIAHGH